MSMIDEKLKKWSDRTGIPFEELKQVYRSLVDEIGSKTKALRELRIRLSEEIGSLRSPATPYYIFVMGDTGVYDFVEVLRERARRWYEGSYREQAIAKGLINEDGEPLDRQGNVITGQDYRRDLFVAYSQDEGFSSPKLAWVTLYGEDQKLEFNHGSFYKIRLNGRTDRQLPRLSKGRGTFVREVDLKASAEDISTALGCFPLSERSIESLLKASQKPPVYSFKGIAKYLKLDPFNGNRAFRLYPNESDEELPNLYVFCRIPAATLITFRELDEIHVFGNLWKGSRNNGSYNLDVYGYITLPFKEVI